MPAILLTTFPMSIEKRRRLSAEINKNIQEILDKQPGREHKLLTIRFVDVERDHLAANGVLLDEDPRYYLHCEYTSYEVSEDEKRSICELLTPIFVKHLSEEKKPLSPRDVRFRFSTFDPKDFAVGTVFIHKEHK